ncbi:MAG: hypothetical protein AAGK02_06685 [Pseudomonadota bacterium]
MTLAELHYESKQCFARARAMGWPISTARQMVVAVFLRAGLTPPRDVLDFMSEGQFSDAQIDWSTVLNPARPHERVR